jgi:alanine dehydrogenase
MKIGIIKEGKIPTDARVPLAPWQCAALKADYGIDVVVQRSSIRCFADKEYAESGIELVDDVKDCNLLMGVKEVPVEELLHEKTYLFFSHTVKKQPQNRKLLQSVLQRGIRLIDYELLKDDRGCRLIAFGHFAGMVGAHNGLWTFGQRTGQFKLKRMKDFHDYKQALKDYRDLQLPRLHVVLTGTGRVGMGARQVLHDMGITEVSPSDFLLEEEFRVPVFTQLSSEHYAKRKDGLPFDRQFFYKNPKLFESAFEPYFRKADIMINGIFWDSCSPAFFAREDMTRPDFNIKVIADITCDIAPASSVPSTVRPSSIQNPVYGYDPRIGEEVPPFSSHAVDVMAIDNLPSELPRDASEAFGNQFIAHILPEFFRPHSQILDAATIALSGRLNDTFLFLQDYAYQIEELKQQV